MERRAFRPDLDGTGRMDQLERRIQQLETEIARLRGGQRDGAVPAERGDRSERGTERGEGDRGDRPPPTPESADPKSKATDRKTPKSQDY
jgi:hypothetical protein